MVGLMDSREPIDWQESHSPTVLVETVVSHQRRTKRAAYRQRKEDHRLMKGLSSSQLEAFIEIDRARSLILDGVTVRSQSFDRRDPSKRDYSDPEGYRLVLLQTFDRWARLVLSDDEMDYHATIDVVCEGLGVKKVDSNRRKQNGWARRNLGLTLELWCDLRGWT